MRFCSLSSSHVLEASYPIAVNSTADAALPIAQSQASIHFPKFLKNNIWPRIKPIKILSLRINRKFLLILMWMFNEIGIVPARSGRTKVSID